MFAYDANYLIDNKFGIILDADGARANRSDEMAIGRIDVRSTFAVFGGTRQPMPRLDALRPHTRPTVIVGGGRGVDIVPL